MSLRSIAAVPVLLLPLALAGCGGGDSTTATETPAEDVETTQCEYAEDGRPPAKEVDLPSSEAPAAGEKPVTLETSAGTFELTLDAAAAPCTVNSFVSLAEQGYLDGTTCHRLVTSGIQVLQCGDPSGTGMGGPGYSFSDELTGEETYPAGTLAMANAGPDTNGSQFFIVYGETPLPASYTVFGTVSDETVTAIEEVAADGTTPPNDGAPNTPVEIESAEVG
jgi:peptidyl-prolyl cis-trans isomerase B (cyclophilin B)